eukprot:GEMP01034909.1.p1 GENE.GEMP01034909.1~~GEMP01034909.1.p1  ORF type:complete len:167 (+),score=40.10 GEMP01034909.1:230-730(+)
MTQLALMNQVLHSLLDAQKIDVKLREDEVVRSEALAARILSDYIALAADLEYLQHENRALKAELEMQKICDLTEMSEDSAVVAQPRMARTTGSSARTVPSGGNLLRKKYRSSQWAAQHAARSNARNSSGYVSHSSQRFASDFSSESQWDPDAEPTQRQTIKIANAL